MPAPSARNAAQETPAAEATPMMAQYLEIKRAHPGCLLFYRLGDFYELFFDDALAASKALDLTLTHRGRHEGADVPMCGVPVHTAETYLARLIRRGFRVAVCEQVEDPIEAKKRGGKTVVRREVVRLITPGTLTEDSLLDARRHNFLAAVADIGGELGLAWLDLSTGAVQTQAIGAGELAAALARIEPGELLLPDRLLERPELFEPFADWKDWLSPLPAARFDSESARRRLESTYGVKALEAFGQFSRAEIAACGTLVDYVELTQKGKVPRLEPPQRLRAGATMEIDAATRRNLELHQNLAGERRQSLLGVIDFTLTAAGARLLSARLAAPLTDSQAIGERLDGVAYFVEAPGKRDGLRGRLRHCPDIERSLSRLSLGRGGPRDLAAIRDGLAATATLRELMSGAGLVRPLAALADVLRDLGKHEVLVERLGRALGPSLPLAARDGGFVAAGYAAPLDELRALRDESRQLIAGLQSRYAEECGVTSLKIRHNNVIGYYVEISAAHAGKLTGKFIHRQTMAGAMRFTTTELAELADRITGAADKALALELNLFADLTGEVMARAEPIALAARSIAALDVASALAEVAVERRYVRPLVDDSVAFSVKGGRHPLVEAALGASASGTFVPNDCALPPESRLWLVTGPNMAGKSTFLRQNAIIAVLAQAGSFVPAEAAHIGIVDRLFSRVGAADDLARGRSTFMVEMVETAAILNQAGPRALVILDEIGRGTATFDGLSIAWATVEHLHDRNACRALFATHYHELTALAARLRGLACHTMRVKEWQGSVVFLHEVAAGVADRSYGIHVGRLAGLPPAVVARAEEILAVLEKGEQAGALARLADDLPLFRAAPPAGSKTSPLTDALAAINPDELSPKEALEALYRLKALGQ